MSSVGMSNHGLSEKSIVTLTIHDNTRTVTKDLYERSIVTLTIHANARTVTKDLYERSIVSLTIHANARTATNMHTQVPLVRVFLTVRGNSDSPQSATDRRSIVDWG